MRIRSHLPVAPPSLVPGILVFGIAGFLAIGGMSTETPAPDENVLREVLRDYPAALSESAILSGAEFDVEALRAHALAWLETKHALRAGSLALPLSHFASRNSVRNTGPRFDRSCAWLYAGDSLQAELLARREIAGFGIAALEAAGWAAMSGKEPFRAATKYFKTAARFTDAGRDHAEWARLSSALAFALSGHYRHPEAEAILRRIAEVRRRMLGPGHSSTRIARSNLAFTLWIQCRIKAATQMDALATTPSAVPQRPVFELDPEVTDSERYRAGLAVRERVLGPEHPDTLRSKLHVAIALIAGSQYEEAEAVLRDILAFQEMTFGPTHQETLRTRRRIATLLMRQWSMNAAEELFLAVITDCEHAFGPGDLDTLKTRVAFATLLSKDDREPEAEQQLCTVLVWRLLTLGPSHPDTLAARYNLALSLSHQWRREEARPVAKAAYFGMLRILGDEHPHTLAAKSLVDRLAPR